MGLADWTFEDLIERGLVEDVVVRDELLEALDSGERLTVYEGFDATSPSLHLGHVVSLRVLRWFQLHGHRVIFLVGDATGRIGDPTGRTTERDLLSEEEVEANQASYREQAGRILDFAGDNPVEVLRNSAWLMEMGLPELVDVFSRITAQRLLERSMFQERMEAGEPLWFVETIYPLLQGWDSVAMEVDVEVGGRDQLFNMMVGRDLLRSTKGRTKHVVLTPLLSGLDGRKMSKTAGNTIDLRASPRDLYDGILRVADDLVGTYARVLTDLPDDACAAMSRRVAREPIAAKKELAATIVEDLHGAGAAEEAAGWFERVREQGVIAEGDARPLTVAGDQLRDGTVWIVRLLADAEPALVESRNQARRVIEQGGVSLDERRLTDTNLDLPRDEVEGKLLRVGQETYRIAIEE